MTKRFKIYARSASEIGELRVSTGQSRDSLYKLAQERDWDAYLKTLEPSAPKRVTQVDVQRLAARFK